jgi:hypothetical protein
LKKIYEIMKENWYEINNAFFKLHAVNVEEERKTEGELILPELSMLKSYLKGSKMINESQDYSAKPVIDEFRGESEDIVVDPEKEFEKEFEEDIKKFEDPEKEFEKEFEEDIKKFEDPEREFEKEFEEDIKKFEDVPSPITGLIPDESFLKLLLLNGLQGEINRFSTSSNYLPRDILQKNILWFLYNLSTEVGYDNPTGQFSFTIMGVKFKFNYSVKCTSDQLTLA